MDIYFEDKRAEQLCKNKQNILMQIVLKEFGTFQVLTIKSGLYNTGLILTIDKSSSISVDEDLQNPIMIKGKVT